MSAITIEIVAVSTNHVPTARGGYQVADVAYKNKSFGDKLEGKKVMSFTNQAVYDKLAASSAGDIYEVTREKNEKGFWEWKNLSIAGTTIGEQAPMIPNTDKKATLSPKSNYETSEERAARQIMIVRQSSISSAVAALKVEKASLKVEDVIDFARHLEAYVLENKGGSNPFSNIPDELDIS